MIQLAWPNCWTKKSSQVNQQNQTKEVVRRLTTVKLRPNESQESLLRRFRKQVTKDGVMSAVRRKRWYVSKSELRRIEKKKAIRRARRRSYRSVEPQQ
jgi:small subunit ribosomal protein S21